MHTLQHIMYTLEYAYQSGVHTINYLLVQYAQYTIHLSCTRTLVCIIIYMHTTSQSIHTLLVLCIVCILARLVRSTVYILWIVCQVRPVCYCIKLYAYSSSTTYSILCILIASTHISLLASMHSIHSCLYAYYRQAMLEYMCRNMSCTFMYGRSCNCE